MSFKNEVVAIGTTDTDVHEMGAGLEGAVVLGIGNTTAAPIGLTVKFYKQSLGTTQTVVSGKSIPANDLKKVEIPIAMEAGDKIILLAASAGLKAFATITDSSSIGAGGSWEPAGVYSAIATYNKRDVVEDGGTSYISLVDDNSGNTPASSPSSWMVNAAKGATGAAGVGDFILSANNAVTGANTFSKTQKSVEGILTTSTAADFSTKQRWKAEVNGSAFVIANPTSPVDGALYDIAIDFITTHSVSFGSDFKIGDYAPSATADKKDRLVFEYSSADAAFLLRGYRLDIGASA